MQVFLVIDVPKSARPDFYDGDRIWVDFDLTISGQYGISRIRGQVTFWMGSHRQLCMLASWEMLDILAYGTGAGQAHRSAYAGSSGRCTHIRGASLSGPHWP